MPYINYKSGFTLIELSIVLVVIGLLVGGVLVGQDLINAARIRAQISQIENFKTATYTFKQKYNYLPGDLPATEASALGFTARQSITNHSNGNGIINSCTGGGSGTSGVGCEYTLFWNDLSSAGMISENFNTATDTVANNGLVTATSDQLYLYLPRGKLRDNMYIMPSYYTSDSRNRFTSVFYQNGVSAGTSSMTQHVTPMEAAQIDIKMDDGKPLTGNVQGRPNTQTTSCISSATDNPYNISDPAYANVLGCNVWFFW